MLSRNLFLILSSLPEAQVLSNLSLTHIQESRNKLLFSPLTFNLLAEVQHLMLDKFFSWTLMMIPLFGKGGVNGEMHPLIRLDEGVRKENNKPQKHDRSQAKQSKVNLVAEKREEGGGGRMQFQNQITSDQQCLFDCTQSNATDLP